jgi:hypothetical protein
MFFFTGPPVSSTNKTDRHDITEILLKVALNTINPNKQSKQWNKSRMEGDDVTYLVCHVYVIVSIWYLISENTQADLITKGQFYAI